MQAVESVRLIKVEISQNNNKWWEATRCADCSVFVRWGRVGEDGQSQTKNFPTEASAIRFVEQKKQEKLRKGYQPQQTLDTQTPTRVVARSSESLKEIASRDIQSSCPIVAKLIAHLSEKNIHNILSSTTMTYNSAQGVFQTPLGVVTAPGIQSARQILTAISYAVAQSDYTRPTLTQQINDYLMLIPQNIGRGRPSAQGLFPNLAEVQRQSALLDALEASLQQVQTTPASRLPEGTTESSPVPALFRVKLAVLEDGKEIDRIRRKYRETRQSMHECAHLDVQQVFTIEIASMREAFEKEGVKIGNIWELWHGTRTANALSILKSGLVIPPSTAAHCTGRMFGDGLYMSDQSSKSLNYCVAPEVRILKSDLTWVSAAELVEGDSLLAFDEERNYEGERVGRSAGRKWRHSTVCNVGRAYLPSVEVVFNNGDRMVVSRGHQFLSAHKASKVKWRKIEELRVGMTVPKYVETWESDQSYDAGWLAGFFDGEGWSGHYGIGANQLPGLTYEKLVKRLGDRRHEDWSIKRSNCGNSSTHGVWLRGPVSHRLRFLGQVRPERLIPKYLAFLTESIFQCCAQPCIAELRDVGVQEVVTLGTSSKTFIAEGYASHNSYGAWSGGNREDDCFMFLVNAAIGKYYVPQGTGERLPKPGYDSTFAQAGVSGVRNNELVVYSNKQVDPVYMVQFGRGGAR